MPEIQQTWTFDSTGVGLGIEVYSDVLEGVWYLQTSSGSSGVLAMQSARSSGGPWFTEQSTTVNTGALSVLRVTGPYRWIRPYMTSGSTGTPAFTVEFLGVG